MLSKILDRVGASLRTAIARRRLSADKMEIYTAIDNNLALLGGFLSTVEDPGKRDLVEKMGEMLTGRPATPLDRQLAEIYREYQLSLSGPARADERELFLGSLVAAFKVFRDDHLLLQRHFVKLFDANSGKIAVDQMRVSQAVVVGYVETVTVVANWASYLIGLIGLPEDSRPPGYMVKFLQDNGELVRTTINTLADRSRSATILSELEELKVGGHDVALVAGGVAIDTFAEDRDYSDAVQVALLGFTRSLPMMVYDRITVIRQNQYRKNKEMKEWATQQMALIQMRLAGVDAESDDYKHQLRVVENYAAIISDLDRKIAAYES